MPRALIFFLFAAIAFAQPTPSPTSLSFPNTTPGADPNLATITIPITDWFVNGNPTTDTNGTGNWLRITSSQGDAQSAAFLIAVVPPLLAPGTYTATVLIPVVRPSGGVVVQSATLQIPVRLTVPSASPTLTVTPPTIVFEDASGAFAGATQNVTLNCSESSPYSTFLPNEFSWISVPAKSTTSATQFTIPITARSSAPASATAPVLFSMCGTVVELAVRTNLDRGRIFVTPSVLRFPNSDPGASPYTQTLRISSLGPGVSTFRVTRLASATPWITVAPETGSFPATITVTANPSAIASGNTFGTIAVSGPANSSAFTFVNILADPANRILAFSQGVSFSPSSGYTPQEVRVAFGQPATFTTSLQTTNGKTWFSVTPSQSNLTANGVTFLIAVNPDLLDPGDNTGSILVNAGTQTIAISVSAAYPDLSPAQITYFANPNGVLGNATQFYSLFNGASANIRYIETTSVPWLSLQTFPFSVTATPAGLPPGIYHAILELQRTGIDPRTVPVSLTVLPAPTANTVTPSPASATLTYNTGQAYPPAQLITLNATSPLSFTLTTSTNNGGNWLSANPTKLPGLQFAITANPNGLAAGVYTGSVLAVIPGQPTVTIPVTLNISSAAPATITVTPANVDFSFSTNAPTPDDQSVTIRTPSPTSFGVTVPGAIAGSIRVHPSSGFTTATGNGDATATLRIGISRLAATGATNVSEALLIATPTAATRLGVNAIFSDPPATTGLRYVNISPCRLVETRPVYNFEGRTGAFGPPALEGGESRTLDLSTARVCSLPADAKALMVNITAVPLPYADLTFWPGNRYKPDYRNLVSDGGFIVANSAIVTVSPTRTISLYSQSRTDLIVDVTGYFTDAPQPTAMAFYPITPCRAVDTRALYRPQAGAFGPPSLQAQVTRRFAMPLSPYCTGLANARAYVATLTAVPQGPLQFITLWPSGSAQPNASSINSPAGRTLANSVVLPAGPDGSLDVSAFNTTDILIDITGYFAPDDGVNGLFYYPVPQCRLDQNYYPSETSRHIMIAGSTTCPNVPVTARAAALNVLSESGQPMPFLTAWPTGKPRPNTSLLNAFEGQNVANAAIIPMNEGSIDLYAYRATTITLTMSGYFSR